MRKFAENIICDQCGCITPIGNPCLNCGYQKFNSNRLTATPKRVYARKYYQKNRIHILSRRKLKYKNVV